MTIEIKMRLIGCSIICRCTFAHYIQLKMQINKVAYHLLSKHKIKINNKMISYMNSIYFVLRYVGGTIIYNILVAIVAFKIRAAKLLLEV